MGIIHPREQNFHPAKCSTIFNRLNTWKQAPGANNAPSCVLTRAKWSWSMLLEQIPSCVSALSAVSGLWKHFNHSYFSPCIWFSKLIPILGPKSQEEIALQSMKEEIAGCFDTLLGWCYFSWKILRRLIIAFPHLRPTSMQSHGPDIPRQINIIIIHSKYFPDSDWLKAHV